MKGYAIFNTKNHIGNIRIDVFTNAVDVRLLPNGTPTTLALRQVKKVTRENIADIDDFMTNAELDFDYWRCSDCGYKYHPRYIKCPKCDSGFGYGYINK